MDPTTINVTPTQFAILLEQVIENRDREPPMYLVRKTETDGFVYIGMSDLTEAKSNGYQKMTFQEINTIAQNFIEHISKLEEKRRGQLSNNADELTDTEQLNLQQLSNTAKDVIVRLTKLGELRIKKIDLAKQKAYSWKTFTIQVLSTLSIVGLPIAYYISINKTALAAQYQSALSDVIKERIARMLQSSYELILNLRQVALDKNEETGVKILARLNAALKQAGDGLILEGFAKSIEEGQKFIIESPAKNFRNKYDSVDVKLAKTKETDSTQFREGFVKEQVLDILTAVSDDYQALKWLTAIQAVCIQRKEQRLNYPDDIQALKTLFSLQKMADEGFFAFESSLGTHSIVVSEKENYTSTVTVNEDPTTLRIENVTIKMLCCLHLQEHVETEKSTIVCDTSKKIYYLCLFNLTLEQGAFKVSNLTREFLTLDELIRKRTVELIEDCKSKAPEKTSLKETFIAKSIEIELNNIQKGLFFNSFEYDLKQGMPFSIYDTGSLFQNPYPTFTSKLEQTHEEDCSQAKLQFVEEQVDAIRKATANDPNSEVWLHAIRSVCQFRQLGDVERLKELLDQKQIQMLSDFEWSTDEGLHKFCTKEEPRFIVTVNRDSGTSSIQHARIEMECGIRILEQISKEGVEVVKNDIAKLNYKCSFKLILNEKTFEVLELKREFT